MIRLFLACCILIAGQSLAYPTLKYDLSGSSNWVPYYINDPLRPGILGELVPIILQEAHIDGEQVTLPPSRTVLALEKGLLDFDLVSPSWFDNDDIGENFVTSEPIIPIKEYFVYLPSTHAAPPPITQFYNTEIGTVRGYYYHNDHDFKRIDFSSEKELILALTNKRVNYAIIGDLPALYWSQQLDLPVTLGVIHSSGYLHMRLRKKYKHLLPDINNAIKKLKSQGIIKEVIEHYYADFDALISASVIPLK